MVSGEQLYILFCIIIGMFLVIDSMDSGLTSAANSTGGGFVHGTEIWTKVIFGVIAGISVIYIAASG